MVQQLNWRDRQTHRAEQLPGNYRVLIEYDRENQVDAKLRERVVAFRAIDAKFIAAHREHP